MTICYYPESYKQIMKGIALIKKVESKEVVKNFFSSIKIKTM